MEPREVADIKAWDEQQAARANKTEAKKEEASATQPEPVAKNDSQKQPD